MIESAVANVKIQLTNNMLGTVPKNEEVYSAHIQSKAKELSPENAQEEVETIEEVEEKGWTGFHRDENGIFIYSYMVKGFLKSAIEVLMESKTIKKIPAYKKWIDKLIFINPRKIHFGKQEPDGVMERPLRAMTPKGERVSVSRSDYVNEGTTLEFQIRMVKNSKFTWDVIREALGYGQFVGLGQWRGSGGYGTFELIEFKVEEKVRR
jgi:uncharacterized protein YlaN (UPF0358 family)